VVLHIGATAAHVDRLWQAFLRRFDLEIVCTQVTKLRLGGGVSWAV
jgi:hypothetical protein